jgi:hypothetical protein
LAKSRTWGGRFSGLWQWDSLGQGVFIDHPWPTKHLSPLQKIKIEATLWKYGGCKALERSIMLEK